VSGDLRGLRVVVARPAHQAEALQRLLEQAGAEVGLLPALHIVCLEPPGAAAAARRLTSPEAIAVFTSRNAVDCALPRLLAPVALAARVLAVGRATADALAAAGLAAEVPESGFNSEALLALPALAPAEVAGRPAVVVTGEGGRGTLAEHLGRRGARVQALAVYRREPARFTAAEIDARLGASPAVLVASSGEGLAALAGLLRQGGRRDCLGAALVLPAQRLEAQARREGFSGPLAVARSAHDADMLAAVERVAAGPAAVGPGG